LNFRQFPFIPVHLIGIKPRGQCENKSKNLICSCFRDLSEINSGGGEVETRGSSIFEPIKIEKWAGVQIYV